MGQLLGQPQRASRKGLTRYSLWDKIHTSSFLVTEMFSDSPSEKSLTDTKIRYD